MSGALRLAIDDDPLADSAVVATRHDVQCSAVLQSQQRPHPAGVRLGRTSGGSPGASGFQVRIVPSAPPETNRWTSPSEVGTCWSAVDNAASAATGPRCPSNRCGFPPLRRPQVDVAVAAPGCEPHAFDGRDPGEGAHLALMPVGVGPELSAGRGLPHRHATVRVTGGEQFPLCPSRRLRGPGRGWARPIRGSGMRPASHWSTR